MGAVFLQKNHTSVNVSHLQFHFVPTHIRKRFFFARFISMALRISYHFFSVSSKKISDKFLDLSNSYPFLMSCSDIYLLDLSPSALKRSRSILAGCSYRVNEYQANALPFLSLVPAMNTFIHVPEHTTVLPLHT